MVYLVCFASGQPRPQANETVRHFRHLYDVHSTIIMQKDASIVPHDVAAENYSSISVAERMKKDAQLLQKRE